jgi:hypothetical protein
VQAQVRLRQHEHAGDGAVREDAELLAEDHGMADAGTRVQRVAQQRFVCQDLRVGDPGVHRVQAHRPRLLEQLQSKLLGSRVVVARRREVELKRQCSVRRRRGVSCKTVWCKTQSSKITPPSNVA